MDKPRGYDDAQSFTFNHLTDGGHICRIVKVEETTSKAGREMIIIYVDTDIKDKQPNYFSDIYKNNKNPDKKWSNSALVRQLVYDAEGNTNRGYKTFIEMVEKSNPGFQVQWGDNFCNCLKNKLVGGVFGREEYLNSYGESKFATKLQSFRTVEDVKNGIEAPKVKQLNPSDNSFEGFAPVNDNYQIF